MIERDVMIPTEITGFKSRNNPVKTIACGPTCCAITDCIVFIFFLIIVL